MNLGNSIVLSLAALMITGCDGNIPFPYILECNQGNGFVDEVCDGSARENGALTIGVTLEDAAPDEVCWEFAYMELESEWCSPVDMERSTMVWTPEAYSEGDLIVKATSYGPGIDQQLFCEDDPEQIDWFAMLHRDNPQELNMVIGRDCTAYVQLGNMIGPGSW